MARHGGFATRPEATHIKGLAQLLNPDFLRPGVDAVEAEGRVLGREAPPTADIEAEYTEELRRLAADVGIDDLLPPRAPAKKKPAAPAPAPAPAAGPSRPAFALAAPAPLGFGGGGAGASRGFAGAGAGRAGDRAPSTSGGYEYGTDYGEDEGEGEYDYETESESIAGARARRLVDELGAELGAGRAGAPRWVGGAGGFAGRPAPGGPDAGPAARLEAALGAAPSASQVERQLARETRLFKLEQVAALRQQLEEDGVDCGGVAPVGPDSADADVEATLALLRLKSDRDRYSTMAEEVIVGAAGFLGSVLDGTREIPVLGWRPDYTGYDATVRARLARARHDTAEMVSSFINTARVGPGTRTLLELAPSFILYPFQNRRQGGLTTGDFRANYQNVRDRA